MVNNHVERVRSQAVITSYPDLVQGKPIQIAETLGREKCVHLPTEHPLNGFKWSPEAVTAIFRRAHKWVDGEKLVQQSKKSCLQAVMGTPCTFSFKKPSKKLWVSRKAERNSELLDEKIRIKRFRKEIHRLALCGCVGLIFLSDFPLSSAIFSGFLAHLSVRSTPGHFGGPALTPAAWVRVCSELKSLPGRACPSLFLCAPLQKFSQLHEPNWC